MDASELRRSFIEFFVARDHTHVPSASLVPADPTLLFTVAGMVPFKSYFLGEEEPPYRRAVSIQKCVRAGGKHNDLDEVGRTNRHLTFFEMLGNFSFGDYFKAEAIPWAWELVTEVLGFDPARLWVTVHVSDDEAEAIWRDVVGVPAPRIQRLDEDNFWRMADTGPCGPCTEIFLDFGPGHGPDGGPVTGSDRYVEFWNLVFMQYDQTPGGRVPLPAPSVDTGAGFERILALTQGKRSVWESDLMRALIGGAEEATGVIYGRDERRDFSLRVLAEHGRTMTMLIGDGVLPSNEDRGYVLRRIMRRAFRHAHLLGVERPVGERLVDRTVELMGDAYPELRGARDTIVGVVSREEERFRDTLRAGTAILEEALAKVPAGGTLPGEVAFQLHDTYGFPLELTEEIARERGVTVDAEGFAAEMAAQRERARAARAANATADPDETYRDLIDQFGPTEFVRETTTGTGRVIAVVGPDADGRMEVYLDRTTFYAESGGQVGDTGWLRWGGTRARVVDTTYAVPGLHRHLLEPGSPVPDIGTVVETVVDADRRDAIRRNHTGTHLLHWALRAVLGEHVRQQGSLVAPDYLRFDFSHYEALTDEQIARIEDLVNAEILTNAEVRHYETTRDEAARRGAIAFFGEKYGERVRVLEAGEHSIELCGGTHVSRLGDIGSLKITSESSIAANQRRVFAVTGMGTLAWIRSRDAALRAAAAELGVAPEEVPDAVSRRGEELKELRSEIRQLRREAARARAAELAAAATDGLVVARVDGLSRDDLRALALAVRERPGIRAVVLAGEAEGGGVALVAAVRPDSGLSAGELLADAARTVGGGGGRGDELAVAGGRDTSRIDEALEVARAAALAADGAR